MSPRCIGITTVPLHVHTAGVYLVALMYGRRLGGWDPLASSMWAEYYERDHAGAITGFPWPWQLLANVLGPVVADVMFDDFGSSTLICTLFTAGDALSA